MIIFPYNTVNLEENDVFVKHRIRVVVLQLIIFHAIFSLKKLCRMIIVDCKKINGGDENLRKHSYHLSI